MADLMQELLAACSLGIGVQLQKSTQVPQWVLLQWSPTLDLQHKTCQKKAANYSVGKATIYVDSTSMWHLH